MDESWFKPPPVDTLTEELLNNDLNTIPEQVVDPLEALATFHQQDRGVQVDDSIFWGLGGGK